MKRNSLFTAAIVLGASMCLTSCGGENTETTTTPNSTSIESEDAYERDRTRIGDTEADTSGMMMEDTTAIQ